MPKSRLDRRHPFRKLFLEGLQDRRLMASDLAEPIWWCGVTDVPATHALAATSRTTSALTSAAPNSASATVSGDLHFQSESEAIAKLTELAVNQWGTMFGQSYGLWNYDRRAFEPAPVTLSYSADAIVQANVLGFSGVDATNVQTSGIDESDNAEFSSDGFAFVFRDQVIHVVDINDPKNLKEVSRIELPGLTATMHLVGNKLVVLSQGFEASPTTSQTQPSNTYYFTHVKFFDVTNRAAPVSQGSISLEGYFATSRIVNGQLVLVQNTEGAIPQPLMINTSPTADFWMSRYETKQEYLDRVTPTIVDSALIRYQQVGPDGQLVSAGVLGDWRDIADAVGGSITRVVTIDLTAENPKPSSVEAVLGGYVINTYVSATGVYLTFDQPDGFTRIVHLNLDNVDKTGITADGFVDVKGTIRNSRFMDEFDGYLRVVTTEDGSNSGGRIRNSANVFVIKVSDGEMKTVGTLLDISPGDQAYSVEFDGDRALVTTGFINPITFMVRDPLHGIDLSDPANPKELSDVVVPGINSYVHWVDSNHLIGVGMVEEQSLWYTQVSLFDVTDLSAPKTVYVWRSTSQTSPWNINANLAMDIHYDAQSKTLTIPQAQSQFFPPQWGNPLIINYVQPIWTPIGSQTQATSDVLVLSIDVDAAEPISLRAEVGDGSGMGRAVVVGDSLIALTNLYLSIYSTDDPTKVLDRFLLSNPLQMDYVNVVPGTQKTVIDVLANDSRLDDYKITAVKGEQLQGSVRILPDQRLEYTNPTSFDPNSNFWWDSFSYEVTTVDGAKFTTMVSIYGQRSGTELPTDATATISLIAVDDTHETVTSTAKGDEFWVEVLVRDGRANGQGVFSSYVDLAFDTTAFEIVGDAEHVGFYTYGASGEKTSSGWKNLGGFSTSRTPLGTEQQTLVRFKLRAIKDAPLEITMSPSRDVGSEVTLYGIDTPIPRSNLTFASLQLPARDIGTASLSLKATDAESKPVTSTKKGDEIWVEVTMQDDRSNSQGVYSAYVDVTFDTSKFEIVGNAEYLGDIANKLSGEKTIGGWRNLGGFRNSTTPSGAGPQSLVRFKIRATEDADLNMTVSPSSLPGFELTLYGIDTVIPNANITTGSLQLPITVVKVFDYDVNSDGILSPIDSLIVINRINSQSVDAAFSSTIQASSGNTKLDVNQDGIVSYLDVLAIVNRINREPIGSTIAPMMNSIDTNDITKKKS